MYQKGDRYHTWFSGREDGMSTITDIQPYRGKYPQWFTHVLTLTTLKSTTEMTVNFESDKDWKESPSHSDWVPKERSLTTHPTRCMVSSESGSNLQLVNA